MRRSAATLTLVLALVSGLGTAAAEKKVRVAVLEYRAGTRALAGIADRIAELLAKASALEVSSPADARRQVASIDADLARCQGDATCVAGLGRKLGVDEVLLVGVSELGDVILGLQRVKSSSGAVLARVAESLPPERSADPDETELKGYLRRLLPPEAFRRYGVIRVRADVRGASVFVNGQPRGQTPVGDLRVAAPASYAVRVTKQGYVDFNARVSVPPDGAVEVTPKLVQRGRGGGPTPWYGKWWLWATVGGAAVITTAVVVGVASEDDPT
ncbi:MAG TPA: PEGA domain-containing protein, partial [Gemmatimonadales bacterium]|nr:PEGA domain-containing protein [Gemmatimonadales bacterium]